MSREPQSTYSHERQWAGFSLLEVILAIAVAGALLAAATSFITSISNIWVTRQERGYFQDHVDGVTEFLNASFSQSGTEITLASNASETESESDEALPAEDAVDIPQIEIQAEDETTGSEDATQTDAGSLLHVSETPVGWARPPGFADYKEPLLNFTYQQAPPLLQSDQIPADTIIQAYLYFEKDEGLSLLWYSTLQEESEDLDDLQRTLISPLVTGIEYIYWDERFERWETLDAPKADDAGDSSDFLLPRYLQLSFTYEAETITRKITIPIPNQYALLF